MEVHVLNGDALAEKFPLAGERIICRECMMDGPVDADLEELFWRQRAEFIGDNYEASNEEYSTLVLSEFERLRHLEAQTINLWFEHDLFCQVNLWFNIQFISHYSPDAKLYLVMPNPDNDLNWSGFGKMSKSDLVRCYENRVCANAEDQHLARALWTAFRKNDHTTFKRLSMTVSKCFPKLHEVCQAHLDRKPDTGVGRPHQRLQSIVKRGPLSFDTIFQEFQKREGIYGLGDLQVKKLLNDLSS